MHPKILRKLNYVYGLQWIFPLNDFWRQVALIFIAYVHHNAIPVVTKRNPPTQPLPSEPTSPVPLLPRARLSHNKTAVRQFRFKKHTHLHTLRLLLIVAVHAVMRYSSRLEGRNRNINKRNKAGKVPFILSKIK